MVKDGQLAAACAQIYDDNATWDARWEIDNIVCARRRINDEDIVVFRGSKGLLDWRRDLDAHSIIDPEMHHLHHGFSLGMAALATIVIPTLGPKVYITGHSLGGAHAWLFAAKMVLAKLDPIRVVCFAPPKPGWADFRNILILSSAELRSYQNQGDPVPDLPLYVPYLAEFVHPVEPRRIEVRPDQHDHEPLRCHHIALYQQGIPEGA